MLHRGETTDLDDDHVPGVGGDAGHVPHVCPLPVLPDHVPQQVQIELVALLPQGRGVHVQGLHQVDNGRGPFAGSSVTVIHFYHRVVNTRSGFRSKQTFGITQLKNDNHAPIA